MTYKWFFVHDANGTPLAAFPERALAEAYAENTDWEIRIGIAQPF